MAREFQSAQPQQVFRQPKVYQPTAQAAAAVDDQFRSTIDQRLQTVYSDLSNQYEKRQLTDQGFATQMESAIGSAPDEFIRQKWQPILTQVKYTVFSNAQGLEDVRIQSDLAAGKITAQQAAERYQAMSSAAIAQDSQSAIRDAATWDLKANQILEASRRSSGGGGRGSSLTAKDLFAVNSQFDYLNYLKQNADQAKSDFQSIIDSYPNGEIWQGLTAEEMQKQLKEAQDGLATAYDDYYSENEKFYTSDLYFEYYNSNQEDATSRTNANLQYIHDQGGQVFVPSYYSVGATEYQPAETPTATPEQAQSAISGAMGGTSYGPRRNSTQSLSFNVPTVAPQTNYRANPLGLS